MGPRPRLGSAGGLGHSAGREAATSPAAGRALTFISGAMAAIYLVVDIALTVAFLRSGLPGGTAATGLLGASAFLGIPIRAAYPIVSALVLISRPENMDLR